MTNNAFTVGLHIGSIVEQTWKLLCYMVFRLHYNVTLFKYNKENQSLVKVVTDTLYATTNEVSQVDIPSFLGTLRHFKGLIKRANSGLYQPPFQLYLCVSSWIFFCFHLPITLVSYCLSPSSQQQASPSLGCHIMGSADIQSRKKSMQSHHNWTCSTSNLIHATPYAYKIDSGIYIAIIKGWAAASFRPSLWQQHVFSTLLMPLSVTLKSLIGSCNQNSICFRSDH